MKRNYKKRVLWNQESELMLIELRQTKMEQLRGARKNSHVLQEIAVEMQKAGFAICAAEIQVKMHNLTSRYRKEKAKIGPSGGSPSDWHLYAHMNSLLGSYKSMDAQKMMEDSIIDDFSTTTSTGSTEIFYEIDVDEPSTSEPSEPSEPILFSPPPLNESCTDTFSALCTPSTSRAAAKKINVQKEMIKHMENVENEIKEINSQMQSTDTKISEMVEIEKNKKEILNKYVNDMSEIKSALVDFLNRLQ